jgi:hypothetical protein
LNPIKIENEDIQYAINSGENYIQVGERKFLLIEVEQVKENIYEVTDSEEEELLLQALKEDENPLLSGSMGTVLLLPKEPSPFDQHFLLNRNEHFIESRGDRGFFPDPL